MSEERTSPSQQDLLREVDNTSQAATWAPAKAAAKATPATTGSNTGDGVLEIVEGDEDPPRISVVSSSPSGKPTVLGPPRPKANGGPPPKSSPPPPQTPLHISGVLYNPDDVPEVPFTWETYRGGREELLNAVVQAATQTVFGTTAATITAANRDAANIFGSAST